ncbi:MAG: 3-hydroxyacyl-CoA dehydrogenase NAD-binding domain-containing protein, partial [Cypionkella sp.]|nr:3-hydroxyacyl-CoA dehydrogenase NAD-binding domain-containing protein [Cypionkella sp.]
MPVIYERQNEVAVITFDNPPLNIFGQAMRAGLQAAITRARAERPERLILKGAGLAFVAGSDAKEFEGPPLSPQLNDVLAELIDLPFPTIAVISGPALGGGLEIALACRIRIASPDATLGLPEVTLGIVPGAGGTQRLPRVIGVAEAVDMIGQGRTITAKEAQKLGLVDTLADDPMSVALGIDADVLRRAIAADHRPAPTSDKPAIDAAHALANRRATGQDAPHIAIDLVAASAAEALDSALVRERAAFIGLRQSAQARALRHVFFAERAAQSQGKAFPAPAKRIESTIVVGGGTMGAAIAYAFALAGLSVHLVETDAAGQARAEANVGKLINHGVERGSISEVTAFRARLTFGAGYENLPRVDLAIEAAFESLEVKQVIFTALQAALPQSTILATNTSYLDVNVLAEGIITPGRFLGLHFFAPAHVMKLLEIVRGSQTSDTTLGQAFALAKQLGKMPVISGVCDGFIGNRILSRYRQVVDVLMLEGSCPKGIDDAMRGFGMAMGPYEAQDLSGLDIAYANRKRQNLKDRTDIRYVTIADHLVEDLKRLGRKTGAGWYDYDASGKPVESDVVTHAILRASDAAKVTRVVKSREEIAQSAVLAMIMEAIRILEEGIAERPQDIDLVMIHGYGFPRWRGGL